MNHPAPTVATPHRRWCQCGKVMLEAPHYRYDFFTEDFRKYHTVDKCEVRETKTGGRFVHMELTLG